MKILSQKVKQVNWQNGTQENVCWNKLVSIYIFEDLKIVANTVPISHITPQVKYMCVNTKYIDLFTDCFKPPQRSVDKPFRLCVSDVFKGM